MALARAAVLQHQHLGAGRSIAKLDNLGAVPLLGVAGRLVGHGLDVAEGPLHPIDEDVEAFVLAENAGFHGAMMPDSERPSNPPENPYPAYILGMSWKRALPEPLRDKHGNTIRTLADARAYMIALDKKRPGLTKRQHWQAAALLLLTAAKKGSIEAATKQLTFALLMDGLLDMKQEA